MKPQLTMFVVIVSAWLRLTLQAPAQEVRIMSIGRDGTITWTNTLAKASSTILFSANLTSGPWLPARHVAATGLVTTTVIPQPRPSGAFYRILAADSAPVPPGMELIPAGYFQMGDPYGEGGAHEQPVHTVYLDTFYLDRFEVTNERMRDALQWAYDRGLVAASSTEVRNVEGQRQSLLDMLYNGEGGTTPLCQISFSNSQFYVMAGKEWFPCGMVTWYGALAYCNYRSDMEGLQRCINFTDWTCDFERSGYRLPTEAEWEKAARGGLTGHHYPWESYGGSYRQHIDGGKANYVASRDPFEVGWPEVANTTPVGYYNGQQTPLGVDMANGYGLYDMAGNVYEWCWDVYQSDWYSQAEASLNNTRGPALLMGGRVIRGGGFGHLEVYHRCAHRFSTGYAPTIGNTTVGFRCARRAWERPGVKPEN